MNGPVTSRRVSVSTIAKVTGRDVTTNIATIQPI